MHIISLDTHKHYSLARAGRFIARRWSPKGRALRGGAEAPGGDGSREAGRGATDRTSQGSDSRLPSALRAGLARCGRDERQLLLDRRRDRGGGNGPEAPQRQEGQGQTPETNASDKITVKGLNMLQHTNRLPTARRPSRRT